MSHFLESFKLLYCPLATEGQQDTFGPYSVSPWAPKSPDFTSKVSQEAPFSVHCPPCSGSFTPPLNRTDNNAAKQGTKLITSTATRKALSCPPPQWLAWDLSGTAVGGKERKCWNSWDQKQAASARCTLLTMLLAGLLACASICCQYFFDSCTISSWVIPGNKRRQD